MSQKTHPIGFRLGVQRKGGTQGYQPTQDLQGLNSRWCWLGQGRFRDTERYADLTQRDRILKEMVEHILEEDGYITNKCIVTRTACYVGIYVDVLRLEEFRGGVSSNRDGPLNHAEVTKIEYITNLEKLLSNIVEYGQPLSIQLCELNDFGSSVEEGGTSSSETKSIEAPDLKKSLKLLDEGVPCCGLIAKVIGFNLSQGRRHRDVLRTVRKEITNRFPSGMNTGPQAEKNNKSLIGFHPSGIAREELDSQEQGTQRRVRGYQMILKGRVGGSERSRVLRYRTGPRPRHTVSAAIDHGFSEVNTPSGKMSVTVMAYRS